MSTSSRTARLGSPCDIVIGLGAIDQTGDVALLLHGGGGSSGKWIELGRWLAARGWHAIAVELRGHGDSPADAASVANPSLRVMADDLVETVGNIRPDATGVGLLVGSSLGAMVGLASVAAHPSFVDRLVLSEPAGRESTDRAQHAEEKRMLYDDPVGFFRRLYEGAEEVSAMSPEELDAFIKDKAAATAASDRAFRLARHEMRSTVDVVELAEQSVVPTLVLLGRDKDTRLGQDSTVYGDMRHYSMLIGQERRRFCAALPQAQVHTLESGHDVYRGMCAEYVDLLSAWLADTGSPRQR